MKFTIIKFIVTICLLNIFIYPILSTTTTTSTQVSTALTTAVQSGIGIQSNYKLTLGNLLSKNHKHTMESFSRKSEAKNLYSTNNSETLKNTETERLAKSNEILFKGWLKYFKYSDNRNDKKPKEFFKNVLFSKQSSKKSSAKKSKNVNFY